MTLTQSEPAPSSSSLATLFAATRAEFLATLRSPASIVPTVLFPVMFWFFFGLPNAQVTENGFNVGAYILASFAAYSMIQTVLFNLGIYIAIERSSGWYKFLRTTPMRLWMFFAAKILSMLLLGLLTLTVLLTVGAISANIQLSVLQWLELGGRALIGAMPFAALAVLIGFLAKGAQSASPIINLVFFPMAFGSGLFIPLSNLPKLVQDFAPYLPAYHSGMLVRKVIGSNEGSSDATHLLALFGFTALFLALAVWAYKRDEGANYR